MVVSGWLSECPADGASCVRLQHVMKFAELTQEVVVARPADRPLDMGIGLTPGRRKANQVRRMVAVRVAPEALFNPRPGRGGGSMRPP